MCAALVLCYTFVNAGDLTIGTDPAALSSGSEQYVIISKEDSQDTGVNFTSSSTTGNGVDVSGWSWTFANGANKTTSTDQNPGKVTFTDAAEGNSNLVTVNVAHGDSDNTKPFCSKVTDPKPVATLNVVIPKITGVEDPKQIWYFDTGHGDTNFPTKVTISLKGITADEAGSITWSIHGESDMLNFDNDSETKTGTSLSEDIHSIGGSFFEDLIWIEANVHGVVIKSNKFTVRTPKIFSAIGSTGYSGGYTTTYSYTVKDLFNHVTTGGLAICEVFSISGWTNDYPGGNNWPASYGNGTVLPDSTFLDHYSQSDFPSLSPHTDPTNTDKVRHNLQTYYAGGTGTPGVSATGFAMWTYNIQDKRCQTTH